MRSQASIAPITSDAPPSAPKRSRSWRLVSVRVDRVVLSHQAAKPRLQVATGRGVGVLLDRQARRCVLHEQRAQPLVNAGLAYDPLDLVGDQVKPLPGCLDGQMLNHEYR